MKLRSNINAVYDVTCVYSGSVNEKNERIPAPDIVGNLKNSSQTSFSEDSKDIFFLQISFLEKIAIYIFMSDESRLRMFPKMKLFSRNGCMTSLF